ncbi:hypothetical protein [Azospirillum sp. TSO35-2]|uniref:hypothetical protein n=1 Tax=Azospirillum sp. TSO35-2 TaxID=716796 RepID=UPI0011B7EA57|nr:hypothetical protein [Azospirillum sp. TSO35-2]
MTDIESGSGVGMASFIRMKRRRQYHPGEMGADRLGAPGISTADLSGAAGNDKTVRADSACGGLAMLAVCPYRLASFSTDATVEHPPRTVPPCFKPSMAMAAGAAL